MLHEPPTPVWRSTPTLAENASSLPVHAMHPDALFTPVDEQRTRSQ